MPVYAVVACDWTRRRIKRKKVRNGRRWVRPRPLRAGPGLGSFFVCPDGGGAAVSIAAGTLPPDGEMDGLGLGAGREEKVPCLGPVGGGFRKGNADTSQLGAPSIPFDAFCGHAW